MKKFTERVEAAKATDVTAESGTKTLYRLGSIWTRHPARTQDTLHILVHYKDGEFALLSAAQNPAWDSSGTEYLCVPHTRIADGQSVQSAAMDLLTSIGIDVSGLQNIPVEGPIWVDVHSNRRAWVSIISIDRQPNSSSSAMRVLTRELRSLALADMTSINMANRLAEHLEAGGNGHVLF